MSFIDVIRYLSGTTLPDHLLWIESIMAYAFAFSMILAVLKFFKILLQGK